MQVGTVATTVDVNEAGSVIDTTTAQIQTNYDSRTVVNMPIIENSNGLYGALQLSLLSAGVTSNGGVGQGTGPSVGGQRPMNNNFMMECWGATTRRRNRSAGICAHRSHPGIHAPSESVRRRIRTLHRRAVQYQREERRESDARQRLWDSLQNRNLNALDAQFTQCGIYKYPQFRSKPAQQAAAHKPSKKISCSISVISSTARCGSPIRRRLRFPLPRRTGTRCWTG